MKKTNTQKFWNVLYIFLGFAAVFALYKILRGGINLGKDVASTIKNDVQAQEVKAALNQYGITDVRVNAVQAIINEIYNAFHKDAWFGAGEDEEKAVTQFNQLQNINEAKAAATMYKSIFGKSLYQEFEKYTYGFERTNFGMKSYLYEAIKNL